MLRPVFRNQSQIISRCVQIGQQRLGLKQSRNLSFFGDIAASKNLARIKEEIEGTTDQNKIAAYFRVLTSVAPRDTISTIENGWQAGKLPASEPIIKEYILAATKLKRLDGVNISGLLTLMQEQQKTGMIPTSVGNVQMTASSSVAGTAGSSPRDPLFIARMDPSWKSQAWGVLRSVLTVFLLLSFAGAVLDEKGGAGGIASRLGGSSIIHQAESSDKCFDDVVGVDEAKGELQEIVMYLKDSSKFTRLGGKLPKGVLLTGPPGTGKTLLARAIAGEAGVPFFFASGSEFEEMYVGVGAKRVRDLFEAARAKSPCIIFIDEIDAIGGSRQVKEQSAMKMTLNQLLVEMDGFEQNNGIIVIAATNFPDSLDDALIRPGRFDKHVDIAVPDVGGRKAILELYGKKVPMSADVDLLQIARGTPGFSGAELANLINQAALKASVEDLKSVSMGALEYAKDKIMMGAERRSAIISPETMKMTAFHEAGHALVALKTDGADPIHKATIMPRGRALGMVMQLPDGDQTSMSKKQMLARLDVCMGGRVAEELVFGAENVTSGASSDIQQATRLAKAMVTKYGLSERVGIVYMDDKEKHSGEMQNEVDSEIKEMLSLSYARAKKVLEMHRSELDRLATGLIQFESLSGGEIVDIIVGKQPNTLGVRSQKPSRSAIPLDLTNSHGSNNGNGKVHGKESKGGSGTSARPPSAGNGNGGAGGSGIKLPLPVPVIPAPAAASITNAATTGSSLTPPTTGTTATVNKPQQRQQKASVPVPAKIEQVQPKSPENDGPIRGPPRS